MPIRRSISAVLSMCLLAVVGCAGAARPQPAMPAPLPAQGLPASPAPSVRPDRPFSAPPPTASPTAPVTSPTLRPGTTGVPTETPDPPTTPPTSPGVPDGDGGWVVEAVELRLEMPLDWRGFLDDDLDAFIDSVGPVEAIEEIEEVEFVFAGIDLAAGSNGTIGGNVNIADVGEPIPERALVPLAEVFAAGLESTEGVQGPVRIGSETLPIGEAATASYTVAGDASTGGLAVDVDMYLFVASDHLVLVTFSAPAQPDGDTYDGIRSIIRSVRED